MRVLLQIRADYRERPGGDATQAMRTAEELRALGVDAELRGGIAPDLAGYDLVHIFNTQEIDEPVRQAIRARSWGLPIALSTVYWNPTAFRAATGGAAAAAETTADRATRALQRLTLGAAAIWLPNARAEADQIAATFPDLSGRVRVVPNAVDRRFALGDGDRFCARQGLTPRGFVLCAARKEVLKNQLGLIRACAAQRLPLVLIGDELAASAGYVAECRALAATSPAPVLFLPHLGPDDLADAYAAARVHVQPSFYETVGLSSLEAALGSCNIVATRNSGIAEYLGDEAWYCDPTDPEQIGAMIAAAWSAPLRPTLGQRLAERYTWRHVAAETLRGYEEVLAMTDETRTTRWLPGLTEGEYITHLEELVQLQLEATAFRDQQYAGLQSEHRDLYAEFRELQRLFADAQRNAADLATGLQAEASERQRTEDAFRALEAHVAEQRDYLAKLESELASRPAAGGSRWPRRSR
jgi:glycosyltransferase involved in cell wall biosynthesis